MVAGNSAGESGRGDHCEFGEVLDGPLEHCSRGPSSAGLTEFNKLCLWAFPQRHLIVTLVPRSNSKKVVKAWRAWRTLLQPYTLGDCCRRVSDQILSPVLRSSVRHQPEPVKGRALLQPIQVDAEPMISQLAEAF